MEFSEIYKIVEYCSEEVGRQYAYSSGLEACRAVPRMVEAWEVARRFYERYSITDREINVPLIRKWGHVIEPAKNPEGFRTVGVRVGDRTCPDPRQVPELMDRFIEKLPSMNPEEAYFAFQDIHPFVDGNGRVGKIILNWKNGTLNDPIWPTNKWGILNP